jgi:hypothetical protein
VVQDWFLPQFGQRIKLSLCSSPLDQDRLAFGVTERMQSLNEGPIKSFLVWQAGSEVADSWQLGRLTMHNRSKEAGTCAGQEAIDEKSRRQRPFRTAAVGVIHHDQPRATLLRE